MQHPDRRELPRHARRRGSAPCAASTNRVDLVRCAHGRSSSATVCQPAGVPEQVPPVGDQRVHRATPFGRHPGEELLRLQRERDGGTASAAHPPSGRPVRSARSTSSSPTIVFASRIAPVADHRRWPSSSGRWTTVECASSGPCVSRSHRRQIGGEVQREHGVGHARRRVEVDEVLEPAGREADLLDQLARCGHLGRLTRRRRACRPASRGRGLEGGAVLLARAPPTGCPRRRTAAAPRPRHRASGRCHARTRPVRRLEVGRPPRARCAPGGPCGRRGAGSPASGDGLRPRRRRARSPARPCPADCAAGALRPAGQRGADQLAEQRMRAIRAALELGVGLRADPVRVVRRAR